MLQLGLPSASKGSLLKVSISRSSLLKSGQGSLQSHISVRRRARSPPGRSKSMRRKLADDKKLVVETQQKVQEFHDSRQGEFEKLVQDFQRFKARGDRDLASFLRCFCITGCFR